MISPRESPGVKHNVIGLVSGGKDSTFNLLHCVANGHEVVALATLTPGEGIDELDSHLYQSVGTRLLPLLAESMALPLFTRCIKGKAVSRGPEYGSRTRSGEGSEVQGDETEDLYMLLKQVKEAHPEVTALASGAILSNYQRLRIEHVCQRLGLVSISYLWQAAQLPLLEKMLECGMEVVLVKVAGVGLGVDLVGKNLREVMPLLRRLEARYGSHPAGEGGEYETLTLSTPLFSHRLELQDTEVVITDPEPYPVAYLRVGSGRLVPKEGWSRPGTDELRAMLGLEGQEGSVLDEESRDLLAELSQHSGQPDPGPSRSTAPKADSDTSNQAEVEQVRISQRGRWFAASVSGRTRSEAEDIGDELDRCFQAVQSTLEPRGLSLALHASHITLLLPSMSLFLPANAVYARYFGTSPPSRATVAVPLPAGTRIRIEVVGFDDRPPSSTSSHSVTEEEGRGQRVGSRQALHVQGLSYWAPANIGPYSQAVVVNSRVALAGQIPLIPASLTLPPPLSSSGSSSALTPALVGATTTASGSGSGSAGEADYALQSILALQHVQRIRDVMRSKSSTGGGWTGWMESCTAWYVGDGAGVGVVREAWRLWAEKEGCSDAPVLFVQASELPKGALVEFQVNLHTGRPTIPHEEEDTKDEDEDEELEGVYSSDGCSWEVSRADRGYHGARAVVFVLDPSSPPSPSDEIREVCRRAISVKAYHLPSISPSSVRHAVRLILDTANNNYNVCITLVPVHAVSSRHGPATIAIEIFA